METVACNLCGSETANVLYRIPDLLLEREETHTTLVKCRDCGLIYQNPRPTIEEMGAHYPPEYESYSSNASEAKTPWLLQKAYQYGIDKRCRFVTRYKSGGRLLDVGCATGTFLLGMRKYPGWELFGVEISEHAAEIARREEELNIFTGVLEAAQYPDSFFDTITLWDVFEHLHNPAGTLQEIGRILKPDGVLVIRVPNADSWDAKLFGVTWAGYDAPRHLFTFGLKTIRKILEKHEFRIRRMSCNIGSYPTFVLSVRFWLVANRVSDPWRGRLTRILYHPIARLASAPFFYLYGLGLRGPLLTVTAIKAEVR